MPDKKKRGTDESMDESSARLEINEEAEQNPPQRDMDGRHSQRLSADLPYGLPTDNTHPTGTPPGVSSGFSELRRGEMPHLEDDNAQGKKAS